MKKIEYRATLNLLAAVGQSGQIGLDGKLPWHCPEDLKFFKEMTTDRVLIVGKNTLDSLPDLPNRTVILDSGLDPASIKKYLAETGQRATIIGGAKTYAKWAPFVDRIVINKIDYDGPADTYMPDLFTKNVASVAPTLPETQQAPTGASGTLQKMIEALMQGVEVEMEESEELCDKCGWPMAEVEITEEHCDSPKRQFENALEDLFDALFGPKSAGERATAAVEKLCLACEFASAEKKSG